MHSRDSREAKHDDRWIKLQPFDAIHLAGATEDALWHGELATAFAGYAVKNREVARTEAHQRHRLAIDVSKHQLATLAVRQQFAALRVYHFGIHFIFEYVHAALMTALHRDHIEATQAIEIYRGDVAPEGVLHLVAAPIYRAERLAPGNHHPYAPLGSGFGELQTITREAK